MATNFFLVFLVVVTIWNARWIYVHSAVVMERYPNLLSRQELRRLLATRFCFSVAIGAVLLYRVLA